MNIMIFRWIAVSTLCLIVSVYDVQAQEGCSNSSDDETIIEYFNEINFEEEIEIFITDTAAQFELSINCPEAISPSFPPEDFELTLTTSSGSMSVSCSDKDSIIISKTELAARQVPFCVGSLCDFEVTLSNRSTRTIFSQTNLELTLQSGGVQITPNLEAATLPICNNDIDVCLTESSCTLSTSKSGEISLCESSTSCTDAPYSTSSSSYSYNENIYFETDIEDKVT